MLLESTSQTIVWLVSIEGKMQERDFSIPSDGNRPVRLSATVKDFSGPKPTLLICHGFCGFKDWGWMPELARRFAEVGFAAFRMNLCPLRRTKRRGSL